MAAIDRDLLREEVKRALDALGPRELLRRLDAGRKTKMQSGDGVSTLCFWHEEADPSCSIHRGPTDGGVAVKCQACGEAGDAFKLVAGARQLDTRTDFAAVLDQAAELVGIRLDDPRFARGPRAAAPRSSSPAPASAPAAARPAGPPPLKVTHEEIERIWASLPPLDAEAWDYLRDRFLDDGAALCKGIPPEGVVANGRNSKPIAGEGGKPTHFLYGKRIAVLLRDCDGKPVAIQGRDFASGKGHGFSVLGSSDRGVFGDPARLRDPAIEWVILVEGLSDYLAAAPAVGLDNERALVLGVAGVNNASAFAALPLAGKRVVLATDADEEGDKCADALAAELRPKGARCFRARATLGAKDLCDMLAAGQNLKTFLGRPKAMRRVRPNVVSVVAADDLAGDRRERLEEWQRGVPIQIEFLDRLWGGMFPNDIVLVGSDTGVGKTELLAAIAASAAEVGRRVRYFALEAERREITRRLKYRELLLRAFGDLANRGITPSYLDFRQGDPVLDEVMSPYEAEVDAYLAPRLRNLFVEYRMGSFTVEDFVAVAEDTETETDIYILDHLHYVDSAAGEDENKGLTKTLQAISDVGLRLGKPIILAAHVRKNVDPRRQRLIPTLEDFQGTSNIPKIITKAVMLARAPESLVSRSVPWMSPTFMHALKLRRDGGRVGALGVVDFNLRTGRYADGFQLGRLKRGPKADTFDSTPIDDWPYWATRELLWPGNQQSQQRLPLASGGGA